MNRNMLDYFQKKRNAHFHEDVTPACIDNKMHHDLVADLTYHMISKYMFIHYICKKCGLRQNNCVFTDTADFACAELEIPFLKNVDSEPIGYEYVDFDKLEELRNE